LYKEEGEKEKKKCISRGEVMADHADLIDPVSDRVHSSFILIFTVARTSCEFMKNVALL